MNRSRSENFAKILINSMKQSKSENNKQRDRSLSPIMMLPRNPKEVFENQKPNETPKSPYNAVSHKIRKLVPEEIACKIGCSGEKCKYCNSNWPTEDMALNGVFSHW
jgi:hypothetical protein